MLEDRRILEGGAGVQGEFVRFAAYLQEASLLLPFR